MIQLSLDTDDIQLLLQLLNNELATPVTDSFAQQVESLMHKLYDLLAENAP